ncbi:hypothetical protein MRX96_030613 [Rhipicephalus microplus]
MIVWGKKPACWRGGISCCKRILALQGRFRRRCFLHALSSCKPAQVITHRKLRGRNTARIRQRASYFRIRTASAPGSSVGQSKNLHIDMSLKHPSQKVWLGMRAIG